MTASYGEAVPRLRSLAYSLPRLRALLAALPDNHCMQYRKVCAAVLSLVCLAARAAGADDLERIGHDYVALERERRPADRFPDRSPPAVAALYAARERLRARLHAIDPRGLEGGSGIAYAILVENLDAVQALAVCRSELWDLNHLSGWQVTLPPRAAAQAVATAVDRERALRLWSSLPAYLDTDIANLRLGLAAGYSVPKTVVRRVLRQIDALLGAQAGMSPFAAPANAPDQEFQVRWRTLVDAEIGPAIHRFADFLRGEYLGRARDTIGIASLPDGARCYAALLRRATTLDRSPRATFALGQATVARSRTELRNMGSALFKVGNPAEILRLAEAAPANRFESTDELLEYSRSMLARSTKMSAAYFYQLPQQPVEIAPMPEYQRGSGISSHYEAVDSTTRPAYFRIDLDHWNTQTRGAAAVTVVHEAIPGHHLQTVSARNVRLPADAAEFSFNGAYVEGWANYVERLCEENGIYDTPFAAIFRRSVLGQSLMIDPAINVMGWSRERVRRQLRALGQTTEQADELIDRVAVQPGQLTSYETGGLEILALREEARAAFGPRFDIREFHERVLEQGDVPLSALRAHVRAWMAARGNLTACVMAGMTTVSGLRSRTPTITTSTPCTGKLPAY
jgi:uncharacterized protein (DUF885 family)